MNSLVVILISSLGMFFLRTLGKLELNVKSEEKPKVLKKTVSEPRNTQGNLIYKKEVLPSFRLPITNSNDSLDTLGEMFASFAKN